MEPVKAWLAEEMALDLAKHVGNSRVEALPQQGDDAKRGALLKGIMWLSEQTKPQPCLKVYCSPLMKKYRLPSTGLY